MRKVVGCLGVSALAAVALVGWANAPAGKLPPGARADKIVVTKARHRLELFRGGRSLAVYSVSLGRGSSGPKRQQGDGRTPEGAYVIDFHNRNSAFFRALHVSYPNGADLARARASRVDPGGDIMVHGLPPKLGFIGRLQRSIDWTNGCIALTNAEMQQVYDAVPDGTPIVIQP